MTRRKTFQPIKEKMINLVSVGLLVMVEMDSLDRQMDMIILILRSCCNGKIWNICHCL